MSVLEAVFALALTAASAVGLVLSSRILEGRDKFRKQMFVYYTNLSNAVMLLYHLGLLIPGPSRAFFRTPTMRYMMTACILVTFMVYFFLLTRFGKQKDGTVMERGLRRTSNAFVHYIVPLGTVLEWLIAADKRGLGWRDALLWLLIPLAYSVFAVIRAAGGTAIENTGSRWPYGFMDLDTLGPRRWARSVCLVFTGSFLLGAALLLVSKLFT